MEQCHVDRQTCKPWSRKRINLDGYWQGSAFGGHIRLRVLSYLVDGERIRQYCATNSVNRSG